MKFLILSDAHGNRFGLEAVLNCGREFDQIISLGDVVGYGAHPNECCELLREREAISLSGNHDAAALSKIDIEWFNPIAKAAILWTREQLKAENRQWLDSLPAEQIFENWGFQIVHASLRQPWEEYITGPQIAMLSFERLETALCFYGHTHVADSYVLENSQENYRLLEPPIEHLSWPDGGEIEIEPEFLTLINPGSCGQPRDGNPLAKAAIFDNATHNVEIFGVQYDIEAARDAIYSAGLPPRLGDRLLYGR
ncbi:MAG TPA: metallophosphoesterase family protein [Abditibacterium sp.]|jgi:diadenosine tetraphosphatase ApaH/serine/threonine PP2A family protein phosphatase